MDAFTAAEHEATRRLHAPHPAVGGAVRAGQRVLPGGDTRTGTFYLPYPLFVARGEGCHLWDADGHQYLDVLNNFTSLVHGHGHTAVVRAIADQAAKGTVHGTANPLQVALAEVLCRRVPSVERLRFCNSGTEATMGALRAAKAFTGRPKILKMAGCYHGSHDQVALAVSPPFDAVPPGLSPGAVGEVIVGAFNDLDRTASLIRAHRNELAAVIVEPITGTGALPADHAFLEGLRAVTTECGVLLVFDEVISFRLAPGGMQEVHGIKPDLTSFGKIIGGGLPVGRLRRPRRRDGDLRSEPARQHRPLGHLQRQRRDDGGGPGDAEAVRRRRGGPSQRLRRSRPGAPPGRRRAARAGGDRDRLRIVDAAAFRRRSDPHARRRPPAATPGWCACCTCCCSIAASSPPRARPTCCRRRCTRRRSTPSSTG